MPGSPVSPARAAPPAATAPPPVHDRCAVPMAQVLLAAFVAATWQQVGHEGVHALAALAVGARVEHFHYWAMAHAWPGGGEGSALAEGIIAGSAALVDILMAGLCILALPRLTRPGARLVALYLGSWSLFSGFGYLMVDPLLAGPGSAGDWAKVVMLLGGEWWVRLPLVAVGAAGTVYGYFWLGDAARALAPPERSTGLPAGRRLLLLPYLAIDALSSLLALWHPLGATGMAFALAKAWMGNSGMFWAYMIRFHWDPWCRPRGAGPAWPRRPGPGLGAAAAAALALTAWLLWG